MVEIGDVVFFKKFKKSARQNKLHEIGFKGGGHGFGVLLGIVPPFQQDPPEYILARLMGEAGFLSFDDVSRFLGAEAGVKCVESFKDTYYGPETDPPPAGVVDVPVSSGLVDATGKPLRTGDVN